MRIGWRIFFFAFVNEIHSCELVKMESLMIFRRCHAAMFDFDFDRIDETINKHGNVLCFISY